VLLFCKALFVIRYSLFVRFAVGARFALFGKRNHQKWGEAERTNSAAYE